MMSFGWRPQTSCYKGTAVHGTCPSTPWFYALLAVALVGGLMSRNKGGAR